MRSLLVLCAAATPLAADAAAAPRPNFVYVLCDDMWKMGGDEAAIPQTRKLLAEAGAQFENFFVSSPKCTPSRSAWLSGRYYHNLRPHGATSGRGLNTSNLFDADALFPTLHRHGYATGVFGKIHNDQSKWLCKPDGNHTDGVFTHTDGVFTHIETECSPCGGYYRNGNNDWVMKRDDAATTHLFTLPERDYGPAYSHAEYGNRSIAWIRQQARAAKPFFAYVGTSGPHLGVVPAPWHREATEALAVSAPRWPNFNLASPDKYGFIGTAPKLDDVALPFIDRHYRDRWGTLFSIDDLVAGVVEALREENVLENTFVLFSSDHGYHLGQFRVPDEKMLPYEHDIRIPFYIRGPGIAPGSTLPQLGANIDVAPTLLELAGVAVPPIMDGKSLVPLLTARDAAARAAATAGWRTRFMSEFAEGGVQKWGTNEMWKLAPGKNTTVPAAAWMNATDIVGVNADTPCPPAPGGSDPTPQQCQASCAASAGCAGWTYHHNANASQNPGWRCCFKTSITDLVPSASTTTSGVLDPSALVPHAGDSSVHPPFNASDGSGEYIYDDPGNQWRLLRILNASENVVLVEWDASYVFADGSVTHREFYDIAADPWQMTNAWDAQPAERRAALLAEIAAYYACRGDRTTASNCP